MQNYKIKLYRKRYILFYFKKTQEPQSPCVISIFVKAFRTRMSGYTQYTMFFY